MCGVSFIGHLKIDSDLIKQPQQQQKNNNRTQRLISGPKMKLMCDLYSFKSVIIDVCKVLYVISHKLFVFQV